MNPVKPVIFHPDPKYRLKLWLIIGLLGLLILGSTLLLAGGIAGDAAGPGAAAVAAFLAVLFNLVWIVPGLILVPFYYRSLQYEILEDEVIVRAGVITKSVKHVPYRTVTNIEVNRGPFDRLFGLGSLKIQTAGFSGQTGAEENLVGLPNYQEVYEQVATALRRFRGGMAPTQAEEEIAPVPAGGATLAAILEEVRLIRETLKQG